MADRIADRRTVITHRRNGLKPAEIVVQTGFTFNFVSRWLNRDDPTDAPRAGRPSKLTPRVKRRVEALLQEDHASTRSVGRKVELDQRTVSGIGKERGLHPYHRPRRPLLMQVHKERRLAFANKYRKHPWSRTAFGDEKIFTLHPRGNSKNDISWRTRREDVPPREQVAHPKQVMYWGAITSAGTLPLVEIKGKLNAAQYIGIIRKYMVPYAKKRLGKRRWWYLQDGSKPHTANLTTAYFKKHRINYIAKEDWPPYSPDANPIENVWAIVEERVHKRNPTTLRGLKRIVKQVWAALSLDELRTLVNSESQRLADIRRARGGHTSY